MLKNIHYSFFQERCIMERFVILGECASRVHLPIKTQYNKNDACERIEYFSVDLGNSHRRK